MATNDELLKIWAQQNGSDYNVLAGAQNGGNTGNSQNTANDLYAEYGWNSGTLPGTSTSTTTQTQTNPTTPTSTQQPTATNPYPYMQDYIDYYTAIGQQPDKSYDEWVSWRNGGGAQQPTTPTGGTGGTGTTPSTTPSTTPTQPSANPSPMDEWNAIMARVDAGTATAADYARAQELAAILSGGSTGGTGGTGGGSSTTPTDGATGTGGAGTGGEQSGTGSSTVDAMTEWQQIMARVNAGQGTIADYYRLQELAGIMTGGGTGTGTGTGAGTGTGVIGGTGGTGSNYQFAQLPDLPNREQAIRDMYDAQINAERAALQEQGDQALSDAQANRDNIAKLYNQQRNAASVEWERQRRNFLEGAATSGLNTGAGSQAELSMMSMAQREQNNLGAAQASAEAEADRNMADIRRSTQAAINEAVMKNDYQKAAALLDEYNEQYNRAMDRAEALAQYGDFSGYAALYGNEAAAQMRQTWVMSNPEIALALGLISQSQYAALTLYSQYPALALSGGTGFSGGSGGGYSGGGGGTSSNSSGTGGGIPSYSGMSPGTYASIINGMIASGEISGADVDRAQELIRQAYAQNGG